MVGRDLRAGKSLPDQARIAASIPRSQEKELMSVMTLQWQLTVCYLLFLFALVAVLKLISLRLVPARWPSSPASFLFSPALCYPSWLRRPVLVTGQGPRLALSAIIQGIALGYLLFLLPPILGRLAWPLRAYLAIPLFLLLLSATESWCRLLWSATGRLEITINQRLLASRSLAEFWGRRWNRLFGDWFRQVCFLPLKDRPVTALGATFLASGLLHEILVSLPYWLVYQRSVWGLPGSYFLLQYLAILVERRWLPKSGPQRRVWQWLVVVLPAPLVLNEATLLIFQLSR